MSVLGRARNVLTDLGSYSKMLRDVDRFAGSSTWNPGALLRLHAEKHANGTAILFEDRRLTWRELDNEANRFAHVFKKLGAQPGDVVALMLDNRPEFLAAQLGLSKLGVVSALINTNLIDQPLIHAINVAEPRLVLVGSEHAEAVAGVLADLEVPHRDADVLVEVEGDASDHGLRPVNELVAESPTHEPWPAHKSKIEDPSCYIYTSGTTGLPKPALITNKRYMMACSAFGRVAHEVTANDIVYVTLPLYHSSGQWVGWGACLHSGAAMALRRKFSASNFWDDVKRYDATRFTYIGELCRYLMNQPRSDNERGHRVSIIVGNGLRPDIWEEFQNRFGIALVREFYGATEGNAPMMNIPGKPGMVGHLGPGQVLVRADPVSGELIRNGDGMCTKVREGENGLLLGRISTVTKFDGYVDEAATQKKIVKDVFKKGDTYFNSGDMLTLHEDHWVAFADRMGDTFRWKGENVSTNEVAEVLNGARGVLESNVYGVQVAQTEGRAGMASLNVNDDFDLEDFARFILSKMPNYQRPHFVRLQRDMRTTGTFKHQKVDYRTEGYDPSKVSDPLYFLEKDRYVPIDAALYEQLSSGEVAPR